LRDGVPGSARRLLRVRFPALARRISPVREPFAERFPRTPEKVKYLLKKG
jgi:hypothetical protein